MSRPIGLLAYIGEEKMNGIMRISKQKKGACGGIHVEVNRSADNPRNFNGDIDWSRTPQNTYLMKSDNFVKDIENILGRCNIHKVRKNAVYFLDSVYTASPEFFEKKSKAEIMTYFNDCLQFHRRTYGDYIINAVIHFDEKTPHMHIESVPICQKKDGSYKLSAKELMGNKRQYRDRQEMFEKEICLPWGMNPRTKKDPNKGKDHKTKLQYDCEVLEAQKRSLEADITDRMTMIMQADNRKKVESKDNIVNKIKGSVTIPYEQYQQLLDRAVFNEYLEGKNIEIQKAKKENNALVTDINNQIKKAVEKYDKGSYEYVKAIGLESELNAFTKLSKYERREFAKLHREKGINTIHEYKINQKIEADRMMKERKEKSKGKDIQYSYEL